MRIWMRALVAITMIACSQFLLSQTTTSSTSAKLAVAAPAPLVNTAAAPAKPAAEAPSHLILTKTTILNVPPKSYLGQSKCDGDGNFYVQSYAEGRDEVGTISKFDSKGQKIATFDPGSSPTEIKLDGVLMFTVNADGSLYGLVFPHSYDRDLFLFNKDGSYKSMVTLAAARVWSPSLFVTLNSGNFMATGQKWSKAEKTYVPFTGIFSSDGTLLKELSLDDDESIHQMAVRGDSRVTPSTAPGYSAINYAISRGAMQVGSDGKVYLLRALNPAVIYAISPGGEVERRFTVDPGDPSLIVASMKISGGRIAILFRKSSGDESIQGPVIEVVDLEGNKISTYKEPVLDGRAAFGWMLACYSDNPEQFTFLDWTKEQKLVLKTIEPR